MADSETLFVYVTVGDRDAALAIGRALVEARLAACANVIDGMESIYRWQGAIEQAKEAVLILKTRSALLETLTEKVRALHDYDCPCVVALPILGGNPAYLDWIAEQTSEGSA